MGQLLKFASITALLHIAAIAAHAEIKPDSSKADLPPRRQTFTRLIHIDSAKHERPFVLYEPKFKKGESRPLVVYLHHKAGLAEGNGRQLGDPALRLSDADMQERYPCFIVAPRASEELWCDRPRLVSSKNLPAEPNGNLKAAFSLIDELIEKYPIDKDRIYIVGGGGPSSAGALAAAAHRPDLFAGVFAADGEIYRNAAKQLANLPIAITTAPKSEGLDRAKKTVQELTEAGNQKARVIESKEPIVAKEAIEWLFRQKRDSQPKKSGAK